LPSLELGSTSLRGCLHLEAIVNKTMSGAPRLLVLLWALTPAAAVAQPTADLDWATIEAETLEHFQALVRLDTSNPPGSETRAVEYLRGVLEREGIPTEVFALEPDRANLVARIRGSGARRSLLIMGHTDVVTVIPERWTYPPFGAVRAGGHVYGRGALDDKDNLVASLMVMLMLHRLDIPLDRDVIFLAESGEEGTTRVGIEFMVNQHWPAIEAEYCLAEGGSIRRERGEIRYGSVTTLEKVPRSIVLTANGPSGHGSVPLQGNAIARLGAALVALESWDAPLRLNETTQAYFTRFAGMLPEEERGPFRDVLSGDPTRMRAAFDYFREHRPGDAAILRASISPTVIAGGNRINVIPSQATLQLDVRMMPDDDHDAVLESIRRTIDDPGVTAEFASATFRPPGGTSLDTEAFATLEANIMAHYGVVTIPTMQTGATDMSYLRARGVHCYGMGPLVDVEDALQGFASHGDQERILEAELYRFVRFYWDVVRDIAGG
jgi:acetylornithine deacetylase/succinyl-diaminopimelate desuccinylase-like protein